MAACTSADFRENQVSLAGTVKLCSCVVCCLLDKRFSSRNFNEKMDIIKKGRSTPTKKNLTTKIKTCSRHFNADKTYKQYDWITVCEIKNKLFCWPCLLFVNESGAWNKSGFGDLNNLHKVVKRHLCQKITGMQLLKKKFLQRNYQRICEYLPKNPITL